MAIRDTILVLDFGSPYTKLIAQKIRENKVYSRILPFNASPEEILEKDSIRGIILSEGPVLIDEKRLFMPKKRIFKLGIPILSLSYGALITVHLLGGKVRFARKREFSKTEVFVDDFSDIFYKLPANFTCDICPQEEILKIPSHFKSIAHTLNLNFVAISNKKRKIYGIRLNPLIFDASKGDQILANFLFRICDCKRFWSTESFVKEKIQEIKKNVRKKRVIIELDGGINSAVCAFLIHKGIGRNLRCIFIDNGFYYNYREDEIKIMKKIFRKDLHLNLAYIDKSKYFLSRLKGIVSPKEKKNILEEESSLIFENETKKIKGLEFLALPTSYSAPTKPERKIKRRLKIIEPLKELFEDEIKRIAEKFGILEYFIYKRPVQPYEIISRIKGEVTAERLRILREAEIRIFEEIRKLNLATIQEIFAILIPSPSENTLIINCLSSSESMNLEWSRLPYEILKNLSKRIANEVKGIDRVAYNISPY